MRHIILCSLALLFLLASCASGTATEQKRLSRVLVSYGDTALRADDVLDRLPQGLTPADSAQMCNEIIKEWIDNQILGQLARESNIDTREIDKLVEDYRASLIVSRYRSRIGQLHRSPETEASIKSYYERNKDSILLEEPILKGVFIKLSKEAPNKEHLKSWMATASERDLDNIEKYGLEYAKSYDYFGNSWVEFSALTRQIPMRFGNPRKWLQRNKNLDISHNGSIYLLHVYEWVDSGQPAPYEFASRQIRARLSNLDHQEYRETLLEELVKREQKNGKLKLNI